MVICSIVALILFKTKLKSKPAHSSEDANADNIPKTNFCSLLKIPSVLYSCIVLGLAGISCTWYLPTLQVGSTRKNVVLIGRTENTSRTYFT